MSHQSNYSNSSSSGHFAVKYPPSMDPSKFTPNMEPSSNQPSLDPSKHPPIMDSSQYHHPTMDPTKYPPGMELVRNNSQVVQVPDIVKKLESASSEIERLTKAIEENNIFFEEKLREYSQAHSDKAELQKQVEYLKREVEIQRSKVSESTNHFFEARVAVLGFKCRVMQLQGELEKKRSSGLASVGPDQAYITQLKEQTIALDNERQNLIAVNQQLQQDLEELGNKKRLSDEEKNRLTWEVNDLRDQMKEKDLNMQMLHDRLADSQQAAVGQQKYHDHTLLGENQELNRRKHALEMEVSRMKSNNDLLLSKVKELEQSREVMIHKLESLPTTSTTPSPASTPGLASTPGPTPKPRTLLSTERERLEQEIQRLQQENRQLEINRDKANSDKGTVDTMFQEASKKSQHLTEEKIRLERELSHLTEQLAELQRTLQQFEQERSVHIEEKMSSENLKKETDSLRGKVRDLSHDNNVLTLKITKLEKEKQADQEHLKCMQQNRDEARKEYERIIVEHEREIAEHNVEMASEKHMTSIKASGLGAAAAKRLNDAMGKIKDLESSKRSLEATALKEREEKDRQVRKLEIEIESLNAELNMERAEVKKTADEDLSRTKAENDQLRVNEQHLEVEVSKLQDKEQCLMKQLSHVESELQDKVNRNLQLVQELDRYRQEMSIHDSEKRSITQQISVKEMETARLKEELRSSQEELEDLKKVKEKKEEKLDKIQQSFTELKTQHTSIVTSLEQWKGEAEQNKTQLLVLTAERNQILSEKEDLQNTCEDFRRESESILRDYNSCAQRLKSAQEEAARWSAQHQKVIIELNRQTERTGLLESTRKQLKEKLDHMDQQIKIYHEDFDRERNAREAAVKVKNLAEERMRKVDRELKELRDKLNQQAVHSLREETYEDSPFGNPPRLEPVPAPYSQHYSRPHHNRSGEHLSGPQQLGWHGGAPPGGGVPYQPQQRNLSGEKLNEVTGGGVHPLDRAITIMSKGYPPSHLGGGVGQMTPHHNSPWTTAQATVPPPSHRIPTKTTADPVMPDRYKRDLQAQPLINDLNNPPTASHPQIPGGESGPYHLNRPNFSGPPNSVRESGSRLGGVGGGPAMPGEVTNLSPPTMACPLCDRNDFKTQMELEVHSAQCTI